MRKVLSLAILLLMLNGCAAGVRPPSDPPGITGQIQEMKDAGILVRGALAPGAANPRLVWAAVTTKTRIAKSGAKATELKESDLQVGDQVQVWFSGGVRESYPEQADASFILVTE